MSSELYQQHAGGCLFYTCSVLWPQLREHRPAFASLPGFYIVPALPQKRLWQISDPKISSTAGPNWGQPRSTAWGGGAALSQGFWAQWHTDWGHQQDCIVIPGILVLLDEFSCSNEEGVASEAVTAPAGFKLPSRNDHWPWYQFFRKNPACTGYYVFIALMMSHSNIRAGCYCKFCFLKGSILSWLLSTTV